MIAYVYDSLSTSYILTPGNQQLTLRQAQGRLRGGGTAQWAHTNVWGGGQLLATYSADPDPTRNVPGVLNFYVDDPLGTQTGVPTDRSWSVGWSGRVMTDYAGNVMEGCHSLS